MGQLYKNKYLIGLYNDKEDDDSLIALFDNSREFATFLNISMPQACVTLKDIFEKKQETIWYCGRRCKIYFIKD